MNRIFIKHFASLMASLFIWSAVAAQSASTYLGTFTTGGVTEYSQYLYVGPSAHITIPTGQQWVIASQYVFIAPTAVIDGGGQMIIDDPSNFGTLSESVAWAGQPTTVDGGNSQILANVVNRNPNNIVLGSVAIAASGGDITTANTDHTFYIGTSFDFALTHADATSVTGNDVILGNNDFRFATTATETGYRETRFAVTNGTGHVVKDSYTGNWVFPVGKAEGDYTPAAINNTTANGMHVLVQDYATSTSPEAGNNGMDRTWNIYADNSGGNSTIDLQHNLITDQSSFSNSSHFVTRWSGTTPNTTGQTSLSQTAWQSNNLAAGTATGSLTTGSAIANASERSLAYTTFATSASGQTAYYSKSSNPVTPLPIRLISFEGHEQNCDVVLKWVVGQELATRSYTILYSQDAQDFKPIGASIPATGSNSTYNFTCKPENDGKGYYRIQEFDNDGSTSFSNVLMVSTSCNKTNIITASPNPTTGVIHVNGLTQGDKLVVYDATGRLITKQFANASSEQLNIGQYSAGVYHIKVNDAETDLQIVDLKIIKQ